MPAGERRGRTKTQAPAEEQNGEKDFTVYASKDLTPLQEDFATWVHENVGDITKMDPERLLALGPLTYHDFQASDFNRQRKEERKAQREADAEQARQDREEARAAKAQAKAEKAAADKAAKDEAAPPATPKRRGRPPKAAAAEGTTAPARRRGRPAKSGAAPY